MAGTPIEILIKAMGAEEVVAALKKVTAEGATVKKSLADAGTSLDTFGTKSKSAVGNFTPQMTAASKSTTDFSGALRNTNPALNDFSKSFNNVASGAPKITSEFGKVNTQTQTLSSSGRQLATSFQAQVGAFASVAGSAIGLFEAYDSVGDSQLAVEKSQTALARSSDTLDRLQLRLATSTARYGAGSTQVALIEQQIATQRTDLVNKTGDLQNAQENLAIVQTHFGKEILPLMMSSFGGLLTLFATSKDTFTTFGTNLKSMGAALLNTDKIMKFMSLSNPFFLALTIGAGIVTAFTLNLGGFRDAVNAAGKAIGDAVPFLRPFLDLLGAAGKFLTDTFGTGVSEAQGFEAEFAAAMEGAGSSTGALSDGVGAGVDASIAKLDELIVNARSKKQELIDAFPSSAELAPGDVAHNLANPTVKPHNISEHDVRPEPGFTDFTIPGAGKPELPSPKASTAEYKAYKDALEEWKKSGISATGIQFDLNQVNRLGAEGVKTIENAEGQRLVSTDAANAALLRMGYSQDQANHALLLLDAAYGFTTISGDKYAESVEKLQKQEDKGKKGKEQLITATGLQAVALSGAALEIDNAKKKYGELAAQFTTTTAKQDFMTLGQQKFNTELLEQGKSLLGTVGYMAAYQTALESAAGQALYFSQGVVSQKMALLDGQKALLQLKGTVSELGNQYDDGSIRVLAYSTAFESQKKSLIDAAIAVDSTRGTIAALEEDMASGQSAIIAWNTGLVQGRLAALQQTLAVEEAAGSLTAYQESIASGAAGQDAFNMAIWDTNRAVAEAFVNLESSRGALQEYNHLISQGIPQYNAYHQAVLDAQMAHTKLDETIFSALGTYQTNLKALDDTTIASQKAGLAFLEGKDSALKWAEGLQSMDFAHSGMIRGLDEVASSFGTILPANMKLTEESAKNLIIAFGDVASASNEMASESVKAGLELTSGVADAIREGGKDVDESLEELEQKLGREFPDSVKDALESANMGQVISQTMIDGLDTAQLALAAEADPLEIQKLVNGYAEDFKAGFDKMTPQMQKSAAGVMAKINYELSQGPKDETGGVMGWLNRLKTYAEALPEQIDPAAQSIQNMANIDFSESIAGLNAYKTSLDSTVASLKTYNEETGGLFANATPTNDWYSKLQGSEGDKSTVTKGKTTVPTDTAVAAPDTSAIDAAQAKLDAFNLNLSALPGTIATIVTAANTSFLPLGDPLTTTIPTKILNFSTTLAQMPSFITASVVGPVNTALSALGDPFLTTIPAKILQFSQTLAQMPGFVQSNVVNPIIAAFNQMANSIATGPLSRITTSAAAAFTGVTNIARSEAPKISVAYDSAISMLITKMAAIGNAASNIFPKVTEWARASADAVQSLASAINSLQDKTITLTTVYESVYTTTTAASGFGPSIVDKPTRLLVGESGPEFVQVTPLSSGANKNLDPNQRLEMYSDPGKSRQNTAALFELANGTFPFNDVDDPSNAVNSLPNSASSSSNWVDVNIVAVGGRNVSATGNALPIFGSSGSGGGGSTGGGGSSSGGSSGGGGGPVGGGGSSYTVPSGVRNASQAATNAQQTGVPLTPEWSNVDTSNPNDWRVVPMTQDPNHPNNFQGWKVVTSDGKNIAVRFNSKAEAEQYVREHQLAKQGGSYTSPTAGGNTVGGGTGTTGGSGTITDDKNTLGAGGEGYYKTVTGYSVPGYIQSAGHGATNPAKWAPINPDPNSWRAEPMVDPSSEGLWKVVDDKGINIAAKFKSESEANEFIQEHIFAVHGNNGGGSSSGDPINGGGGGSVNGDPNALAMGNYSGGTYKTATGYTVPNYIQSAGHGATNPAKWAPINPDPRSWSAVQMVDDPTKWKVVDDKGINIAAGFVEEDQANEFIQEHMFAAEYPNGNATGGLGTTLPPAGNNNNNQNHTVPNTGGNNQQGGGLPSSGGGGGGGGSVQQSQVISQNSIVNQGNNSNVDLMSGTNSRLRIQNGVVIEATGIYAGYNGGALPGLGGAGGLGGGGAGSGSILESLRGPFRSGQDNQFGIFDHGPAAGMYDVGTTPCRLDDILDGGPGGSGGGGLNGLTDMLQLMMNILKNFTMPFNINTFLDGESVYKNQTKRYLGNLGTFLN